MKWLATLALTAAFSAQATPEICFTHAGQDYGIDPLLLTAISIQESRMKMDAVNSKSAGNTEDVCGMQINSTHFKKLKKFNITRERLMNDPCICIYTGAWVLAHNFRSYGRNWDSVGIYNAGPSEKKISARRSYAELIKNIYRILLAQQILLSGNVTENSIENEKDIPGRVGVNGKG